MKSIQCYALSMLLLFIIISGCSQDTHILSDQPNIGNEKIEHRVDMEREIELPGVKSENWKPSATLVGINRDKRAFAIPHRGNIMDPYNVKYDSKGNPVPEMARIYLKSSKNN